VLFPPTLGEAGHDRDLGSIPTMLFNSQQISYNAFGMCQFDQADSSQMSCKGGKLRNSYMVSAHPERPGHGGARAHGRLGKKGCAAAAQRGGIKKASLIAFAHPSRPLVLH
jgi:hypothetical protein